MKSYTKLTKLLATLSAVALTASVQAQNMTVTTAAVSGNPSLPNFPTASLSGLNGSLVFQSIAASPAGGTIAGGASQGVSGTTVYGETFYYTGPAATLGAITFIDNGGGGGDQYMPVLYDLGSSLYNLGSTQFNPSIQTDLLNENDVYQLVGTGSQKFTEIDIYGDTEGDSVTMTPGQSYFFGWQYYGGSAESLNFERSSGTQSDPNGGGDTFANFASTADNASPYSGSPRNEFIGVYVVPEPTTMAIMGGALLVLGVIRRRK